MPEAGMEHLKVSSAELGPGVHELKIEGSLDWSNFSRVEGAFAELFRKGGYRVVINLTSTKYISSAGFGCFIGALDTAMKNGGDLIFAGTPKEIREVFNILGLSKILRFSDDTKQGAQMLKR